MRVHRGVLVLMLGVVAIVGCGGREEAAPEPAAAPAPVESEAPETVSASAMLQARADQTATGDVVFEQPDAAVPVNISASIEGAPPGTHGLHIHEFGDCSAEDFTSAGGHFNPLGAPHGGPTDAVRHAGDLGNIEIGEDGTGTLALTSDLITLDTGYANSIHGRAVILHELADDLTSQPTGAAGGRIACGVIEGG